MVENIEQLYQTIADLIVDNVPEEGWVDAKVKAVFHPGSISLRSDYMSTSRGGRRSFDSDKGFEMFQAFRDMRKLFKDAGKPLWGRAVFYLEPDGKFKMDFDYDDCDENGNAIYDSEKWLAEQDEWGKSVTQPGKKQE